MTLLKTGQYEKIFRMKATSGVCPAEGMRLAYLAAQVPDGGVIVELGSAWGRSAAYMADALREKRIDALIYCIDLWDLGKGITPERHHAASAFDMFANNLLALGLYGYVRQIKSDSAAAIKTWRDMESKPIDLLFIDADHSYESVLQDYETWQGAVREGGRIVFHDYNHAPVRQVIHGTVKPSGNWRKTSIWERLWSATKESVL